jgi:phosphoribosyl 1,2-cyclic phosphodiesterase
MRVTTLASGSKGNCIYIEGGDGALLLDAGLSMREILARLKTVGGNPERIQAILVTHEHGDHIRGVAPLARRLQVPVAGSEGTLSQLTRWSSTRMPPVLIPCQGGDEFAVGDFRILPFSTSHDALEPLGFCVQEEGIRLGCCTDTGYLSPAITEELYRCDMVILESNHCPEMLKNGPYPAVLKQRIRSRRGHLSNPAASECLRRLGREVPIIQLAHLSEINNTPSRALASAREGLGLFAGEVDLFLGLQHAVSPTRIL